MAGGMIFEFRCADGHLTERIYPYRTEFNKHDQIACPVCLKAGKLTEAYLVFACPEPTEKKGNAGISS